MESRHLTFGGARIASFAGRIAGLGRHGVCCSGGRHDVSRIDSVRTPGARPLLVLTGDLGADARDELARAVEGALIDDGAVELDLRDVTSIDRAVVCYLAQLRVPVVTIARAPADVARWLGAEARR